MVSRRSHLRKAEARGAREHWGLEPYQQAAAAALTGEGSSWALRRCASPARAPRR